MRRLSLNILSLAGLLLTLQACSGLTYSAKEIHGKVIDSDTGQPLEGVNIVAQWNIDRAWVGDDKALLRVTETVTDDKGDYFFPTWGPISLPLLSDFREGRDPLISIFKSGYDVAFLNNGPVSDIRFRVTPLGEFKWNNSVTKLKKWEGSTLDYWWRVGVMSGGLPDRDKAWKQYPRMALALINEQKRLKSLGAPAGLPGISSQGLSPEDETFLKRFER